jgi:DNA (cytosine-5)-methyltransferase 1
MPEKNRFPAVLQPVCATGDKTHCLTASQKGATEDGTGRGTPIVIDMAAFNQGQNAQYEPHIEETEVMDSLVARGPHAVGQPIPFRKSKRACSTTDNETWVEAEASNTLNNFDLGDTRTTHAVVGAVYENHAQDSRVSGPLEVAPTVAAKFGTGGGNVPLVGAMAVRRLTPVECERLQGFPDNWSRISWKGKPEDQCPDGPRYKACGNSMAVPVMRWIGERIAAADAKHFPHA